MPEGLPRLASRGSGLRGSRFGARVAMDGSSGRFLVMWCGGEHVDEHRWPPWVEV